MPDRNIEPEFDVYLSSKLTGASADATIGVMLGLEAGLKPGIGATSGNPTDGAEWEGMFSPKS
jgi:hypothetical protein